MIQERMGSREHGVNNKSVMKGTRSPLEGVALSCDNLIQTTTLKPTNWNFLSFPHLSVFWCLRFQRHLGSTKGT